MIWRLAENRDDPRACALADRHYSRQRPGARGFIPPGRCMVLVSPNPVRAVWVTVWQKPQYTRHAWPGAWVCSIFRNEAGDVWRSSDLIRQAVAATRFYQQLIPTWICEPPPTQGMITFVDPRHVRSRNPGYCFLKAGFRRVGRTRSRRLHVLQMSLSEMPPPEQPRLPEVPLVTFLEKAS